GEGRRKNQSVAAHACREGPGAGPDPGLRAVSQRGAVAEGRYRAATGRRADAVARGAREAGRAVGVHSVLLLLDLLPELLVERGPVSGTGGAAAGVSLDRGFARRGDRRAAGCAGGPVQAVSLPHDHELHADLPEGAEPGEGDRRDQAVD